MEKFLLSDSTYMISVLLLIYVALLLVLLSMLSTKRIKRNKAKRELFDLLLGGLQNGTILDREDVFLIYKDCDNSQIDFLSFERFLEWFILMLYKEKKNDKQIIQHKQFIKSILAEEISQKPFDGVNEHEKLLLTAIEDCAIKNEITGVKSNLRELSRILIGNQKRHKASKLMNKWSIPISVAGIILSIVIWLFGRTSISENDIEKINKKTEQIVSEKFDSIEFRFFAPEHMEPKSE